LSAVASCWQPTCNSAKQLAKGIAFSEADNTTAVSGTITRMAKLFFYYSTMNAGKPLTCCRAPITIGTRYARLDSDGRSSTSIWLRYVKSRIGLAARAWCFAHDDDLEALTKADRERHGPIALCIGWEPRRNYLRPAQTSLAADRKFVDATQASPVTAYGLPPQIPWRIVRRQAALLAWADNLIELRPSATPAAKTTRLLVGVGARR